MFAAVPPRGPADGDVRLLRPTDAAWPGLLTRIPDPPPHLHVLGDPAWLDRPAVAIVGTRRATPRGLAVAHGAARALALQGWTIVSGLALGIDAAAHRGALAGGGGTVAVMGTGPDRVYPACHRGLQGEILARGCAVTELERGAPALPHHFPKRNRIIAALVQAVIVVEAPLQSGAMHTARTALDYDRDVFAVPGPVDLEAHRGCHRLLRDGAHLFEGVGDVERVLGPPPAPAATGRCDVAGAPPVPDDGSAARWILDRLDLEGVRRDDLRRRWPGDEATWLEGLTALELAGLILRLPGGRVARRIWSGP
ncbi:DNA-processing protein DprA [bacterium]|nr:DNA-processing protein DprA [bacterium]